MNVVEAIEKRRSLRSLSKTKITEDIIKDLAKAAILAPSCFNKQPEKFVFVYEENTLEQLKKAL